MNILFPEVYGFKGARAGDVPFQDRHPVEITDKVIQHIWHGESNPKKGGHKPGAGRNKKTEFPSHWSMDMLRPTLLEMFWYGRYTHMPGTDDYQVQIMVDGFLLQGWVHQGYKAGGAYPIAGKGIIYNKDGKQVIQVLDATREEGVPKAL